MDHAGRPQTFPPRLRFFTIKCKTSRRPRNSGYQSPTLFPFPTLLRWNARGLRFDPKASSLYFCGAVISDTHRLLLDRSTNSKFVFFDYCKLSVKINFAKLEQPFTKKC